MPQHNDDVWQVHEGDTVEIVTATGECFEATCTSRERQHSDPRTGEVRETTLWMFDSSDFGEVAFSITRGLRSRESDPEFPVHNQVWSVTEQEGLGLVDEITVFDEELKWA